MVLFFRVWIIHGRTAKDIADGKSLQPGNAGAARFEPGLARIFLGSFSHFIFLSRCIYFVDYLTLKEYDRWQRKRWYYLQVGWSTATTPAMLP